MTVGLAIVLMQKDEGELLLAWIDHHLGMTSPERIYIFDNGSTCQKTRKILKDAEGKGVHISYEFSSPADFERKGDIICKTIQSIQSEHSSDFVIPLDCDEFLGLQSEPDTEPKFDQRSINDHLHQLTQKEGFFKVRRHYFNHPHEPDLYHINNTPGKYFFGCSILQGLDVGFHSPKMADQSSQEQCLESDLIAFHYHNKIFSIRRANAINKMRGRVNNFTEDELKRYIGLGMHLLKDLRGIDAPFTTPKQKRTRAFLNHIQTSKIAFPHDIFQESHPNTSPKGNKSRRQLKQELSKLRRSVTAKIENFATIPSSGATIRLQAAGADIKRHYNTNYSSLQKLKRTIKRYRPAPSTTKSKGPITINIRNNRSLANAYLATFTANRQQNIVFDCQNFWSSIDTQLLTLTSSAVQADEDRVILRHERTCNPKLQKQLMLHFLMLALPQSAFKNKGR